MGHYIKNVTTPRPILDNRGIKSHQIYEGEILFSPETNEKYIVTKKNNDFAIEKLEPITHKSFVFKLDIPKQIASFKTGEIVKITARFAELNGPSYKCLYMGRGNNDGKVMFFLKTTEEDNDLLTFLNHSVFDIEDSESGYSISVYSKIDVMHSDEIMIKKENSEDNILEKFL
jgi:hypothetical protein